MRLRLSEVRELPSLRVFEMFMFDQSSRALTSAVMIERATKENKKLLDWLTALLSDQFPVATRSRLDLNWHQVEEKTSTVGQVIQWIRLLGYDGEGMTRSDAWQTLLWDDSIMNKYWDQLTAKQQGLISKAFFKIKSRYPKEIMK
jgi:hypothetical protein